MVVTYYAKDVNALEPVVIIRAQLVCSTEIFRDDTCHRFKL